ncbi:putative lipoprotein [Hydrogenophaga sp. RAC07]|uniref:hypothetical protein n=1 Tax=Hydrogenophaga sp. RAC07 TaxID=1842537 RepID=UPI00083E0ABE|nr:hypothetical protein [Hydrogenophaga sp. RAC07]AOF84821.1 putative lipoprotein [Hydrogenophaga sp. RAC07]
MSRLIALATLALAASLLAACGGGGPVPSALLTTTAPTLVLAASGTARLISVTNQGPNATEALQASATGLPTGSWMRSTCPAQLMPGASCLLLVTPGAVPTAAPGDLAPDPATVTVTGANSNAAEVRVTVLGHGSVHQGGYVFALDDTPPLTESVGGKVLATAESAPMHWSPTATPVPGIYIDSTVAEGGCEGAIDGQCNTRRILAQYPTDSRDFAAAACEDSRHGGYAGWYLPALCELSYDNGVTRTLCGTQAAPRLPDNARSRLHDTGLTSIFDFVYWSSTQNDLNGGSVAYLAVFGRSFFTGNGEKRESPVPFKCARAITP